MDQTGSFGQDIYICDQTVSLDQDY